MSAASISATPPAAAEHGSFWQRRVLRPIVAELTQGVTPDHIALTLAVGTACSLLPFFGFTALFNLAIGVVLRMNQPILQTLNQLLGPLQIVLILVYVRMGETIWAAEGHRFTFVEMMRVFRDKSFGQFLGEFGWAGVHAFTAWSLTCPVLIGAIYYSVRPALRRLAARSVTAESKT